MIYTLMNQKTPVISVNCNEDLQAAVEITAIYHPITRRYPFLKNRKLP